MNKRVGKNMRGFMCQTPATTAACMASEPLSVIVQRRTDRTLYDHARLINNTKYTRLLNPHSRGFPSVTDQRRSVTLKSDQEKATQKSSTDVRPLTLKSDQEKASEFQVAKDQVFQVVVMRVSLHCQGCAGKVKKHLSKMEGVTSFSIDLESKRVTVMGHVSPRVVVESISKVKRAELWASAHS